MEPSQSPGVYAGWAKSYQPFWKWHKIQHSIRASRHWQILFPNSIPNPNQILFKCITLPNRALRERKQCRRRILQGYCAVTLVATSERDTLWVAAPSARLREGNWRYNYCCNEVLKWHANHRSLGVMFRCSHMLHHSAVLLKHSPMSDLWFIITRTA